MEAEVKLERELEESPHPDNMAEISAEELMEDEDYEEENLGEEMESEDDGREEEEMRVPKKTNEENESFDVNCQPSSSNVSDSAFEENHYPDDLIYADTSQLVISEKKKRKRKRRTDNVPPKGTDEYREYRQAEAKRRRIQNAEAHRCPFCDFTGAFPSVVKKHLETNHRQGRHECDLCPMIFDTQSERRKHSALCHPVQHTCDHCGYIGKKPYDVRKHILLNHENGIKCTVPGCNITIAKWFLKRHLREVHEETSIALKSRAKLKICKMTCSECDFVTADAEEMNEHHDRIHIGSGIDCPHGCGEKLSLEELREHLENVHDVESPEVSKKDKKPPRPNLDASKNSVDDDEELEEEQEEEASTSTLTATETYATTSGFVDAQELSERSSDYLSEADDSESPSRSSRKSRSSSGRSSAENKPPQMTPYRKPKKPSIRNSCGSFACDICGATFDTLYLLKKHHKRTHEKVYSESRKKRVFPELPCTFEGCAKLFRSSGTLQDHLNWHNKVYPFHCDHCDQSFHSRARFAVHLSKYHHTSIRVYQSVRRDLPTSSS